MKYFIIFATVSLFTSLLLADMKNTVRNPAAVKTKGSFYCSGQGGGSPVDEQMDKHCDGTKNFSIAQVFEDKIIYCCISNGQ